MMSVRRGGGVIVEWKKEKRRGVCGRSFGGIEGSNPAGSIDVLS